LEFGYSLTSETKLNVLNAVLRGPRWGVQAQGEDYKAMLEARDLEDELFSGRTE